MDFEILPDAFSMNEENFYTKCTCLQNYIQSHVADCSHMRFPYFSEQSWRVPIPATVAGKSCFWHGIYQNNRLSSVYTDFSVSPYNKGETIVNVSVQGDQQMALFAEVLVATRELLNKLGKKCAKEFGVYCVRGSPFQDPIPTPNEIVKNLNGPAACYFRYSLDDLAKSIAFWSSFSFRRR